MAPHPVNANVGIQSTEQASKGLGLFASCHLSKGLKIMSETPVLKNASCDEAIAAIEHEFAHLPGEIKGPFTRLYAGPVDISPLLPPGSPKTAYLTSTPRLQEITNCIPNAYIYYNDLTDLVTLFALKDIRKDEEITVSYFQENPYLKRAERAAKLAK
ncbi:hypothetical protein F4780DRAFT_778188 [Xylariomycetidae sp. FL0641]|nr:hypothetical protein F4780DRAFT_778188 [Xylariomycetidae sp. FL0641]